MRLVDSRIRAAVKAFALIGGAVAVLVTAHVLSDAPAINALVTSSPWGPFLYVALKAVLYVAAPLSSLPLQIAAGAAFGLWPASCYTLIGSTIGGAGNFWIARRLGRPALTVVAGSRMLARIDALEGRV